MKLRAIIVDDEENARSLLKSIIAKVDEEIDIIGEADSMASAKKLIELEQFDLLFLDIELIDGTGFNLIEKLTDVQFEIIFTTAFNEYAIEAFKVNAVDYLLKPIDSNQLKEAISRAIGRIESKSPHNLNALLKTLNKSNESSTLSLKERGKITFINKEDILYFKADGVYTHIVTKMEKYVSSNNLGQYEASLNSSYLVRVHRSYIVNKNYIREYYTSEHSIKMNDGSMIPVSSTYAKNILE